MMEHLSEVKGVVGGLKERWLKIVEVGEVE